MATVLVVFAVAGQGLGGVPLGESAPMPAQPTRLGVDRDGDKVFDGIEEALEQAAPRQVKLLLRFQDLLTDAQAAMLERSGFRVLERYKHLPNAFVLGPSDRIGALSALPFVELIEPNHKVQLSLDISLDQVAADRVQDELNITGQNVTIAFIDGGIDPDHPDLRPQPIPATGCPTEIQHADPNATCTRVVGFCNAIANVCSDDPAADIAFDDTGIGHGTHVAGTAAGNGQHEGGKYKGVAPNATMAMCRAFDGIFGSGQAILRCYDWVIDYNALADQQGTRRMSILSNSWGCFIFCGDDSSDSLTQGLINVKTQANVFTVVAAGNSGSVGCPLSCAAALFAVGAVDENGVLADFSGQGPGESVGGVRVTKPELVAPGVNITAAKSNPTGNQYYKTLSGTSMATPHAAGVAALLKEWNTTLTKKQVWDILTDTTDTNNYGFVPNNQVGWGLVNAWNAVNSTEPFPSQACSNHTNPVIKGYVRNASDANHGLQDVVVKGRCHRAGTVMNETRTNATGYFELRVGGGNYTLQATPPDTTFFLDGGSAKFQLANVSSDSWQNVSLPEGGRLSVKVINGTAANISNVVVQVADENDPGRRFVKSSNTVGEVLFRLPASDYAIQVDAQNVSLEAVDFDPVHDNVTVALRENPAVMAVLTAPIILEARAGPDRTVQNNTAVVFDGLRSQSHPDGLRSYQWDFGDGIDTSVKPAKEHTYKDIGTYLPTLTITNATGVQDTDQAIVHVHEAGKWNTRIVLNDPTGDEAVLGMIPTFLTQGQYPWLDLRQVLVGQNNTHVTFYLRLRDITNDTTHDAQYGVNFKFDNKPFNACVTVDFATSVLVDCPGSENDAEELDRQGDLIKLHVPFDAIVTELNEAQSRGSLLYDITASSTDLTIGSITFLQPVDFAGLTGVKGSWTSKAKNERPVAGFSFTPSTPNATEMVRFTDTSTDYDGSPSRWLWKFGNGFETGYQNPLHAFSKPGCYWTTLQVWDPEGATSTSTQPVRVKYANGTVPNLDECQATGRLRGVVRNATNINEVVPGVVVRLDALDGAFTGVQNTTTATGEYFLQAKPGTYNVTFLPPRHLPYLEQTVANVALPDNGTAVVDVNLQGAGFVKTRVVNAANASLEARMRAVVDNEERIRFTNATGHVQLRLPPGTHNVSLLANPELLYDERWNNTIVTAFNVTEINGTLSLSDLLVPKPYPRQSATVNTAVSLNGLRTIAQPASVSSYNWTFGDGGTASGSSVTHTYTAFGEYHVNLTVQNTDNETASELVPVYVSDADKWNARSLAIDAVDAVPSYQDLTEGVGQLNNDALFLYLRLANLTNATLETEYRINFTISPRNQTVNSPVEMTACVALLEMALRFPTGCARPGLTAEANFTGDWILFRFTRGGLGLLNHTYVVDFDARTATLPALGGDPVVVDTMPDAGDSTNYYIAFQTEVPVANFLFSPVTPTTLDFVSFFDLSSDYDGDVKTWDWVFGDGNTSTKNRPGHRYTTFCDITGQPPFSPFCTVKLTVNDDKDNQSATFDDDVPVRPEEEAP